MGCKTIHAYTFFFFGFYNFEDGFMHKTRKYMRRIPENVQRHFGAGVGPRNHPSEYGYGVMMFITPTFTIPERAVFTTRYWTIYAHSTQESPI